MVLRNFPPAPAFPHLRLASLQDVHRLAVVATLGFRDSEIFRFERPHYDRFPQDAVAAFRNFFRDQICNPRAVVVVAEDEKMKEDEDAERHNSSLEGESSRVIAGVGIWILEIGSRRNGQFSWPDKSPREPALSRDLDPRRLQQVDEVKEGGERKYFKGLSICDKLVVHPTYWGRGHGSTLIRLGQSLSRMDGVAQGVMPSYMGEKLFLKLGYKPIDTLFVEGDEEAKGFHITVAIYTPKK